MGPVGWTTIPRAFSWLLPAQSLIAGVAIYSTNFVYGIGSIPFILAVVATGLHFILGLYFCFTQNRPGRHHLFVVPTTFTLGAGVWCAALYYFARTTDVLLRLNLSYPPGTNHNAKVQDLQTWTYVGCGVTGVSVVLDIALITLFIVTGKPKPQPPLRSSTYISGPIYAVPPIAAQFQQQQQHLPAHLNGYGSPTGPMSPVSPLGDNKPALTAVYTNSPSPSPYPTSTTPTQQTPYYPYDRRNRLDVIRRMCSLQHPDGHWDYSPELAELVKLWGGRELAAAPHGVTALANACLSELCNYVWSAQREGREQTSLSQVELISLQMVNWDLTWAKHAIDRATAWMDGFR
ncbi:hypothetical protein GQ53DRAFT_190563 [Thozetella sp. PMI_491]|nr:hypothetical protein GQ53DRAFT_190563 [Thozetella sp. PMI_491]